jgi:hypothetical protein
MPNEGGFETRPYNNHQRSAAKALGLTVPLIMQMTADEVVE